jgi:branched-chain amino acid transport system substrate-binding protein
MRRRSWGALALAAGLGACTEAPLPANTGAVTPPPVAVAPPPAPVVPAAPKRIALLLPLSGTNAGLASAMLRAVQLALGAPGAPLLDLQDTGGDPARAAAAARVAQQDGDAMILGPLTAAEARAVAPVAQGAHVPVLAFTSDPSVAQPGVWVLGITPVQQMDRLVRALREDGRQKPGAALPRSVFGDAYAQALAQAAASAGMGAARVRQYAPGTVGMTEALKSVSDFDARHPAGGGVAAAPVPVDALLVGEIGGGLSQLGELLPVYDLQPPAVRILGPALWESQASHLQKFAGAWYAAPEGQARGSYVAAYGARYGGAVPPALSDIAFDAASIGRVLAQDNDFSEASLTRAAGFAGVDGLLALQPDGHVRRALAVFEVGADGSAHVVKPAPTDLASPGA